MRKSSVAYLRRKSSAGLLQSKDLKQLKIGSSFPFTLKRKKKTDEESYNLETVSKMADYFIASGLPVFASILVYHVNCRTPHPIYLA